jgi:hypothetical protein
MADGLGSSAARPAPRPSRDPRLANPSAGPAVISVEAQLARVLARAWAGLASRPGLHPPHSTMKHQRSPSLRLPDGPSPSSPTFTSSAPLLFAIGAERSAQQGTPDRRPLLAADHRAVGVGGRRCMPRPQAAVPHLLSSPTHRADAVAEAPHRDAMAPLSFDRPNSKSSSGTSTTRQAPPETLARSPDRCPRTLLFPHRRLPDAMAGSRL